MQRLSMEFKFQWKVLNRIADGYIIVNTFLYFFIYSLFNRSYATYQWMLSMMVNARASDIRALSHERQVLALYFQIRNTLKMLFQYKKRNFYVKSLYIFFKDTKIVTLLNKINKFYVKKAFRIMNFRKSERRVFYFPRALARAVHHLLLFYILFY